MGAVADLRSARRINRDPSSKNSNLKRRRVWKKKLRRRRILGFSFKTQSQSTLKDTGSIGCSAVGRRPVCSKNEKLKMRLLRYCFVDLCLRQIGPWMDALPHAGLNWLINEKSVVIGKERSFTCLLCLCQAQRGK